MEPMVLQEIFLSRTVPWYLSPGTWFLGRRQLLVLDAMGLVGRLAELLPALLHVGLVVALEPAHLAFALERQDVRRDPVEEPAVVADHDGAAVERQERFLEH